MSSAARTPSLITHTGLAVSSSNKYVSLSVLLAGIFGGFLLILSLFLFCKYCRNKSQGPEGVGVASRDGWVLRDASFSLEQTEDEVSIRGREEAQVRRGSWTSSHSRNPPDSGPEAGCAQDDLEDPPRSPRLVDDHVKTNIFLHRQKSFQKTDSPPITCFAKSASELVECEVAVEIHPGPSSSSTTSGPEKPLLRHVSVSSLGSCQNESSKGSWDDNEEAERVPWRASSTDWTKLETSLDFWRQEHSSYRAQQELSDSQQRNKVRYNDTGSLEEVSVDNCVDYFVEDEIMVHLEADRENIRQQYQRLWQLRATLAEDEGSKNTQVKQTQPSTSRTAPSSPDHSPEAAGSHATSFDSNTEPLLDTVQHPPHLLQLQIPSYEMRRQNYRNILNWRLRKMEARNARRHCGRQPSLDDTSFDSVDTEESSTDASRLDQATTSFESTDSASVTEQQVHRLQLQQLRADSGYRSLENPVPNSLKLLYPQQHVTSSEGGIPSLGESFEDVSDVEGCMTQRHSLGELESDEGLGCQYNSKKRMAHSEYTRDYSVDEKSDALFREFSRCEESASSKRQHRLTTYRRLRGYPYPHPYPKDIDDEITLASVPIIRVASDKESTDHL